MKHILFFILLIFSFVSCTPEMDKKKEICYKEIICPECKGIGIVKADAGTRVIFGLMTFGVGAMCETTDCGMCQGTGVVIKRVINDSINN